MRRVDLTGRLAALHAAIEAREGAIIDAATAEAQARSQAATEAETQRLAAQHAAASNG